MPVEPHAGLRALRWIGTRTPDLPGKDRLLRAIVPPDDAPDVAFDVPFYGFRYQGSLRSWIDWRVYFYGAYEPGTLELLRQLAAAARGRHGETPLLLDVGANGGQHTLFAAGAGMRVVAVDPFEEVLALAEARVARNGLSDAVRFARVALGAAPGTARFWPPTTENRGVGSIVRPPDAAATSIVVPVVTGDALIDSLGADRMDVVKIDVEGAEAGVLEGLRETLHRDRPAIVVERADGADDAARFAAALYPRRQVYRIGGGRRLALTPCGADAIGDLLILPEERGGIGTTR